MQVIRIYGVNGVVQYDGPITELGDAFTQIDAKGEYQIEEINELDDIVTGLDYGDSASLRSLVHRLADLHLSKRERAELIELALRVCYAHESARCIEYLLA